jgi:hypothetical protein
MPHSLQFQPRSRPLVHITCPSCTLDVIPWDAYENAKLELHLPQFQPRSRTLVHIAPHLCLSLWRDG